MKLTPCSEYQSLGTGNYDKNGTQYVILAANY